MKILNWVIAALVIATTWTLGSSNILGVQANGNVELDELPLAVRTTIEEHAKGGRIVEIGKEKVDGKMAYEAEVILDGKEIDILVSSSGKFLGSEYDDVEMEEESVVHSELPDGVKETLTRDYADIQFKVFHREVENGYEIYEAIYEENNANHEVKLTAGGHLIELEKETPYSVLPAVLRAAIESQYADARIEKEVDMVQQTFYEIMLTNKDGVEYEIKALANGQVLEVSESDCE